MASQPRYERRPRGEIDRNYFFGDTFIRTGSCLWIVIAAIALLTPFTIGDALAEGMYQYLTVMALFALIGAAFILYGRHLRRCATHWDRGD
ncbi:MAG: hypothetical protein AB7J28_16120 [Hyphomonadaceae bacterium]